MRFVRRITLFICVALILALSAPALAAGCRDVVLEQYAAELSLFTGLKYYKNENTERYLSYKRIHTDLDWETVVTYVNIGLDTLFYSSTTTPPDPAAVNVLVNKYHPLPSDYMPAHLEAISPRYSAGTLTLKSDARVAFEKLCADAGKNGYSIYAISAYRSFNSQKTIYDSFFNPEDPVSAVFQDLRAARPGFSEHQTGLAVDIAQSSGQLAGSAAYGWYSKNAHKYGFIIRYPYAKEPVVGYSYEPWHLRYLGVDLATAVYKSGLTYDEYYVREIDMPGIRDGSYAVGVTAADTVTVGGTSIQLSAWDVLGNTYYDLLDIASVLKGTPMQFDVVWDDSIGQLALLPGAPYTGDHTFTAFEAGRAAPLAAVSLALQIGQGQFLPAGYTDGFSCCFMLKDILGFVGAHAEEDGAGGLSIVPGPAPAAVLPGG